MPCFLILPIYLITSVITLFKAIAKGFYQDTFRSSSHIEIALSQHIILEEIHEIINRNTYFTASILLQIEAIRY